MVVENSILLYSMELHLLPRPVNKFSSGTPFEYRNINARFENAVNTEGMTPQMKLLEMPHWFAGTAGRLVECYMANRDPEDAYAKARSQLDDLFGATCDSVTPLVRQMATGKPIAENDYEAHCVLFTDCVAAEATATEIGQLLQLDRRDVIADIAANRVRHIAKRLWEKDEDLKEKEGRPVKFSDFKRLLQRQISMISSQRTLVTPHHSQQQQPVKVAANEVTGSGANGAAANQGRSHSAVVKNGVQKSQDKSKCGYCSGLHNISNCEQLLRLTPDQRLQKFREKGICWGCLEQGHISTSCPNQRLRCRERGCGRFHPTLLHGTTPPPQRAHPQGALRVAAQTFVSGGANPTITSGVSEETVSLLDPTRVIMAQPAAGHNPATM